MPKTSVLIQKSKIGVMFTAMLLVRSLSAGEVVEVDPAIDRLAIGKQVYVLADASKQIDIREVVRRNIQFQKSDEESLNFGQTNHAYWLRIEMHNPNDLPVKKFLEIDFSNIDSVEFYQPTEQDFSPQKSGMLYPFDVRMQKNRNFVYEIEIEANTTTTYYIRATNGGGLIIPLVLWNADAFHQHHADTQQGLGIYYGVMIVMILYNLFIFISVKDLSYLFYVTYILGFLGIQLVLTGHGFQYLWGDFPWFQRNGYVLTSCICLASVMLFSQRFLNMRVNVPRLNKLIRIFILLEALLFFGPFFLPPEVTVKVSLVLTVPQLILVFAAALLCFVRQFRPARYFLLAFTVLLVAAFVTVMKYASILPSNVLTDYGLYFGSALEVILLSIALADRINLMKKEKEEAQLKTLEMQKILTESYARFVPKDFLANLGKESILDVKLGDQIQKDMAVMFSDIRSFTSLSETMTPSENFNFINSYLGRMSPIIQRHNGFIDKFIGDAIMALFQRTVIDAVSAGVEMQQYLKEYNSYRTERNYEPIQIGIGIHSGSLMLGTIGAEERLEGTVISDTVNLASRIESLTKIYGSKIAVSESTVLEVKNQNTFHFRFLDRVKVKGKQQPVSIYEIMNGDDAEQMDLKLKTKGEYEHGVRSFHSKNFEEAGEFMRRVLQANPSDPAAQFYAKRIHSVRERSQSEVLDLPIT